MSEHRVGEDEGESLRIDRERKALCEFLERSDDWDEDEPGSGRVIQWLALVPLLIGLAFVSLVAYRVYLLVIYEKSPRITSALHGALLLGSGIVFITWGIRGIRSPHRP